MRGNSVVITGGSIQGMSNDNYWTRTTRRQGRRRFLQGSAVGAAGFGALALVGCGDDDDDGSPTADTSAPTSTTSSESLVPDGMAERFPEIAENHWSKMTFSKNTPKTGGTLKTHIVQDATQWDPTDPAINTMSSPFQLFYNRLVKPDMSFDAAFAGKDNFFKLFLKEDLATTWELPDPQTYVFHLNKNVKFHNVAPMNGAAMTAEDVVYSFEQYKNPKAIGQAAILRDVDSVVATDQYTVTVKMKRPASYFLYSLAGPLIMIFNKKAHVENASVMKTTPLGTGPFMLDKHEYRKQTNAKRNPDYFVPERPYLDNLELYWMPDDATKIGALRSGQIDTLLGSGAYDTYYDSIMSTERGNMDVNVFQHNAGGQPNFAVNHRLSPWNDVRVRRGLSMALDRDAIVEARFHKGRWAMGLPTDWSARHFPPKGDEFGPYFQYNPKEAKAMLDQAGFPKDFEILISSVTGAPDDQAVLAMEYWKQIGLNPSFKVVDSVAFSQRYNSKDFTIVYSGPLTGGTDLDDFGFRMMHTGQVANIQGISDPEVDRITEKVQETFDREPREALGEELLQRELDQVFRIWGASQYIQDFKRPYVQGSYISHDVYFFAHGWGMHAFEGVWLDKA